MRSSTPRIPHSWSLRQWPTDIFPGCTSKARYLIRVHKSELLAVGAIVRIRRELVAIGPKYVRWLEKHVDQVRTYKCPANRQPTDKLDG